MAKNRHEVQKASANGSLSLQMVRFGSDVANVQQKHMHMHGSGSSGSGY